jgi:putative ABC transport system permease protein
MFLALKEMARAKVRFGLLIAALGLLVFLILFQQSLQNELLRSFTGAIENQTAPVLVYSVDGQTVIQASVITPDLEAAVRAVPEAEVVGRINQGTFTVSAGGDLFDTSILGYENPAVGAPSEVVEGRLADNVREAVASSVDATNGFDVGDTVTLQPSGYEIIVVGIADNAQLNAGPTLFTQSGTYLDVVAAQNPDAGVPLPNVLGVAPAEGVSDAQLADDINEVSIDLEALTRQAAAEETPGVSQVRSSFRIIFLLYAVVVPCVTGLFFLIITFQKANALPLLRAIGAPAGRLVAALLIQALIIMLAGFALGTLLYLPVSTLELGGLSLRFETAAVLIWAALLISLGVASALLAARRVLAIDPIEATTGAGVGT